MSKDQPKKIKKPRRHKHIWQTGFSYGAWGHDAYCIVPDCNAKATFVAKEA